MNGKYIERGRIECGAAPGKRGNHIKGAEPSPFGFVEDFGHMTNPSSAPTLEHRREQAVSFPFIQALHCRCKIEHRYEERLAWKVGTREKIEKLPMRSLKIKWTNVGHASAMPQDRDAEPGLSNAGVTFEIVDIPDGVSDFTVIRLFNKSIITDKSPYTFSFNMLDRGIIQ